MRQLAWFSAKREPGRPTNRGVTKGMSKKKRTATTEKKRQPAIADAWAEGQAGRPEPSEPDARAAEVVGLYQEIAIEVAEAGRLADAVEHIVKRFCDFGSFEVGYGLVDPAVEGGVEVWWASADKRFAGLREALHRGPSPKAGKRAKKNPLRRPRQTIRPR